MPAARARRLFALSLVATGLALLTVALLTGGGQDARHPARHSAARTEAGAAPTVLGEPGQGRPGRKRELPAAEDLPAGAEPERRSLQAAPAARAVGRRFVRALLRFEVEGASPFVRRELRATAAPRLARFLLANEPRRPAGLAPAARGALVTLEVLSVRMAQPAEFAATIERRGRTTGLIVALRHRQGRWWVSALH